MQDWRRRSAQAELLRNPIHKKHSLRHSKCLPGIITGVVLALARVAGETAPLLFTSFNNRFFSTSLTQPISSITVQVFNYAISPYEDWHRQAWAGALVLVSIVLICSMAARIATARVARIRGQ